MLKSNRHTQGRGEWVPTRDGRSLYAMVLDGPSCGAAEAAGAICPRPTVVFEAGAASTRSMWALVQRIVGTSARAVVYDRAGLGRSPDDPEGPSLDRAADDLNDVLSHFGPGPFVLVAHGAGGPIVRAAAARRRSRISGLVLVDPTDEHADLLFRPGTAVGEKLTQTLADAMARSGMLKLLFHRMMAAMPDDVAADLDAEAFGPSALRGQQATMTSFVRTMAEWRKEPPELGRIPLTIVSAGRPGQGMTRRARAAANGAHWRAIQEARDGRHVIARDATHFLPVTNPDLVAREILDLAGCTPGRRAFIPHPWIR